MRYIELVYDRINVLSYPEQTVFIKTLLNNIDKFYPDLFSNKSIYKGGSGFGTRNRIFYDMFYYTAELLNNKSKLTNDEINVLINIVKEKEIDQVKNVLPNIFNKVI